MSESTLAEGRGDVFITRHRYDRLAVALVPTSLIGAISVWWISASPIAFAVPVCLICLWVLMRFSVRPEGEVQPRLTLMSGGFAMLFGMLMIVLSMTAMGAAKLAGYSGDTAGTVGLLILGPTLPIFIYALYRADRQRKRDAEDASLLATEQWATGEPAAE
jgi:hypothetical protein